MSKTGHEPPMKKCEHCGRYIKLGTEVVKDGKAYCSENCAAPESRAEGPES